MDTDELEPIEISGSLKVAGIAIGVAVVLVGLIVIQYQMTKNREGTIVLPAGETYLGPTPTPLSQEQPQQAAPQPEATLFAAQEGEEWTTYEGNLYPYTISAPASLSLVTFENDAYDIYAIDWNNLNPSSNVLIGVDNLANDEAKSQYIDQDTRVYVENWWKQFGALKGVSSIVPFVNKNGLQGYRAKYFNQQGQTPYLDVFFEVPGRPELVVHMANGVLQPALFDEIVDSVSWGSSGSITPSEENSADQ